MLELLWKGALGGAVTALIVWLSKRDDVWPGILPLFPTFAIIALIVVGAKHNTAGFKDASMAGLKTIPAYVAFLATNYLAIDYMDYRLAIGVGLIAWLAVAGSFFWGVKFTG